VSIPRGGRSFRSSRNRRISSAADEIVWEFVNPHRGGPKQDLIAQLFDVVRIDPSAHAEWLPAAATLPRGPVVRP